MRHYGEHFIGGEWVPSHGQQTMELVDPAIEETFATMAIGDAEDVNRAVAAALRAFKTFSLSSIPERIALFERIIASYSRRTSDLQAAMAQEMGCPGSVTVQVTGAVAHFEQAIETLKAYAFERPLGSTLIRREPIGVCGLISPWNWPVQTPSVKLASALASGCTVVLKPSEYSSTSAVLLAEILAEAYVPAGVFNLVLGDGTGVGPALCSHPDVDLVSFTGSTRTGILVAQAAAPTVKRVAQELGGKSANIILPDADLVAAARWNIGRGFFNSGQSCHAPSRILVHRDQEAEVLSVLTDETAKVRIGHPMDPAVTMGPLVNRAQYDRVQHFIEAGLADGARIVAGGPGRPEGVARGFYARPTVFADVRPHHTIAREEIFGPVLSVIAYDSEDEAVEIANGTPYGLGAYVFGSSAARAKAVGDRLRAGRVFLNGAAGNPASPMGGYKQSGNGREMGVFGLEEFLETKAVFGATA